MGFFSSVSSFVSSAVSTISRVASSAWEKTKEVAHKAVDWMANEAETFIGDVKEMWGKVKPYINAISPWLKKAAAATATWPWLSGAITILDQTLQTLLALENSPVLKKIESAINWTIKLARKFNKSKLSEEEIAEAEVHKDAFHEAKQKMQGNVEQLKALDLASIINDFALVNTAIVNIMDANSIRDFEHYLRLRATQKLLNSVEQTLSTAQSIDDISADEIFMLEVGAKLLASDPTLSDQDTLHLDNIILKRFNKKLIPFVFEEMIIAWGKNLSEIEDEWTNLNREIAKDKVLKSRLEIAKKISELSKDEEVILLDLLTTLPIRLQKLETLEKQDREMRNYVYAAEGFLQFLEKTEEQLIEDEQDYLIDYCSSVGKIIIDCAQYGKKWESLNEEERGLIIDFANIFEEASKARAKQLVEVEVGV